MNNFSVAVCIPTYNQAQYISETLDSLLKQETMPDEVWICDDCSTDNTAEVVESYVGKFDNIYYLKNYKNLGLSQNIYQLLRKPSTDCIVMLHSDDILYPRYIKKLSKLLSDYPEAGVAHSNIQEINEYSLPTRQRLLNRSETFEDSETALKASIKGYKVAANVVMFRKAALDTIELPSDWPNFVEDYNIFARLAAANWGNVFSSEILGCYRVWVDQKGARYHRKEAELNGYIRLFNEVLEPSFINKGWNKKLLFKQRKHLALLHSVYLNEVKLEPDEQQRIILLLKELDDSSSVNRRIRLHTGKYSLWGKLFLLKYRLTLKIRDALKKSYLALIPE